MMVIKKYFALACTFFLVFSLSSCGTTSSTANEYIFKGTFIETSPNGFDMYQIPGNGIDIGYTVVGEGEPLLMLMGLGGTVEDWNLQVIEMLSDNYQLILMDNRGMGYSTANDDPFNYELFAADAISVLDTLEIDPCYVLGWSMGSVVTQQLIMQYPDRFTKAVIYATSDNGEPVVSALEGNISDDPIVQRQSECTYYWVTPIEEIQEVTIPVMFMVGTNDTIVGTQASINLAGHIEGAWLTQFKNASHMLMYDLPEEFAETVLLFLQTNEVYSPSN